MLTNYEDKKEIEQGITKTRKQMNLQAQNCARFLRSYCDNTPCEKCIFAIGHLTSAEDPIVYDCKISEPFFWNIV